VQQTPPRQVPLGHAPPSGALVVEQPLAPQLAGRQTSVEEQTAQFAPTLPQAAIVVPG
jgi:hypothetical protein